MRGRGGLVSSSGQRAGSRLLAAERGVRARERRHTAHAVRVGKVEGAPDGGGRATKRRAPRRVKVLLVVHLAQRRALVGQLVRVRMELRAARAAPEAVYVVDLLGQARRLLGRVDALAAPLAALAAAAKREAPPRALRRLGERRRGGGGGGWRSFCVSAHQAAAGAGR